MPFLQSFLMHSRQQFLIKDSKKTLFKDRQKKHIKGSSLTFEWLTSCSPNKIDITSSWCNLILMINAMVIYGRNEKKHIWVCGDEMTNFISIRYCNVVFDLEIRARSRCIFRLFVHRILTSLCRRPSSWEEMDKKVRSRDRNNKQMDLKPAKSSSGNGCVVQSASYEGCLMTRTLQLKQNNHQQLLLQSTCSSGSVSLGAVFNFWVS